jgi:hypothetical protein
MNSCHRAQRARLQQRYDKTCNPEGFMMRVPLHRYDYDDGFGVEIPSRGQFKPSSFKGF